VDAPKHNFLMRKQTCTIIVPLKQAGPFRMSLAGRTISEGGNHDLLRGRFMTDLEARRDPASRSGAVSWVMLLPTSTRIAGRKFSVIPFHV
jgi:hypothetical protein